MGGGVSGKGLTSATSLIDGNTTIDLSGSPLRYGKSDAALRGSEREVVEKFENKTYTLKREQSFLVDEQGNIIGQHKGGKGSVRTPVSEVQRASTLTHNHPREEGTLGGTFSTEDMEAFTNHGNLRTMRATAKEGTYTISRGSTFDSRGFMRAFRQAWASADKRMDSVGLGNRYTRGEIDYNTYSREYDRRFNAALVETHNWLIANQREYGYNYSLERR